MGKGLPPRVFEKHGAYYHVRADGRRRVWTRLCSTKDGLPGLYRALAEVEAVNGLADAMPKLVADWLTAVSEARSKKTQANDAYMARQVADSFRAFRAGDITPPDVAEFLSHFRDRPRTHNAYRSFMRELMRFAEERGYRREGSNPVSALRTMKIRSRSRYITDSELRRIKVGAMYGGQGQRRDQINRSGPMICALIDMAYLTGQRIGDLLALEWSAVGPHGISFEPSKVQGSTGAKVLIEWTPRLRSVIERVKALKRRNLKAVFTTQDGQRYTYSGAVTAWKRAVARAGVKDVHFHDIRAKAMTDVDRLRGIQDAQRMGAHSTQAQTADYVRHKTAVKTTATR